MAEKKTLPKGISIRKDGRYQARYTFNGKRHTIYGKTLKEVQKKLRDAQYEIDHGIFAKPEKLTVNDWYQIWVKEYRQNVVRETTQQSNAKSYKHIKAEIGNMKLQSVRPEHIQRVLNKMKSEGYSGGYIDHTRMVMNMLFQQAYLNGMIVTNPVSRTVLPKVEDKQNTRRRALTEWEQRAFLDCVESRKPFYAPLFYLGFSTGMRIGEINTGLIGKPKRVTIGSGDESQTGWEVEYFLNGAIGVNDVVQIKSSTANGYYLVHKVTFDGDNLEGDWVCTAQVLEIKAQPKLDKKAETAKKTSGGNATSAGEIKKGDKVKVTRTFKQGNKTKGYQYAGGTFVCWYDVYDVIQVKGDRVVIGIGSTVTAAVNIKDLAKV